MEVLFKSELHQQYVAAIDTLTTDQLEALRLQMQLPIVWQRKAGESTDQMLDRLIDHCADNDMLTFR